jgi:hypothetical protein
MGDFKMRNMKFKPTICKVCSLAFVASVFPSFVLADNKPPLESVAKDQGNTSDIIKPLQPSHDFNPLTATDDDLDRYGLPPKPDSQQDPEGYDRWKRMVTLPLKRTEPQIQRTTIQHKPSMVVSEDNQNLNGTLSAYSTNWSGFADIASNGTFTYPNNYVTAQIAVPNVTAVTCNSNWEYSSEWVGFDGVNSNDVLQAGIESDAKCSSGIQSKYYSAWFEWYPNYAYRITNFPVKSGDAIDVEVWYTATSPNGHAYFANYTQGVAGSIAFSKPSGTTFYGNSEEWVLERPTVNGVLATLPKYVSDTFSRSSAYTQLGSASPASCAYCTSIYDINMVSGSTIITNAVLSGTSSILFLQP